MSDKLNTTAGATVGAAPDTSSNSGTDGAEPKASDNNGYKADKPIKDMTVEEQRDYFKKYSRKHEDENKRLKSEIENFKIELDRAIDEAVKANTAELNKKFGESLAEKEVEAQAVKMGFHNPKDAFSFMQVDEVIKGADVDVEALNEKLKGVVEERPYLVNSPDEKRLTKRRMKNYGVKVDSGNGGEKKSAAEILRNYKKSN